MSKKQGFDPVGSLIKGAFKPTPKGALKEREREARVNYVLATYELKGLSAGRLLEYAKFEGISIDQIEKRIVAPLAELKRDDEKEYQRVARKFKSESSGSLWLLIFIGIGLLFWFAGK